MRCKFYPGEVKEYVTIIDLVGDFAKIERETGDQFWIPRRELMYSITTTF